MDNEIIQGKQDSIEVNRNASGKYAFSVKIYFDNDKVEGEYVIDKIKSIYLELQDRFKD